MFVHLRELVQHEDHITRALGNRTSGRSLHPFKSLARCKVHGIGVSMERNDSAVRKDNTHGSVSMFNCCNNISVADEVFDQRGVREAHASQSMGKKHDRKAPRGLCDGRVVDRMRDDLSCNDQRPTTSKLIPDQALNFGVPVHLPRTRKVRACSPCVGSRCGIPEIHHQIAVCRWPSRVCVGTRGINPFVANSPNSKRPG